MAFESRIYRDEAHRDEVYRKVAEGQEAIRRGDGGSSRPPQTAASSGGAPPSSELAEAANELGIDFSAGRQYQDPEDPNVWDGKQYVKLSQLLNRFYVLQPDELRKFQEDAVRAGLLDPDRVRWESHDPDTYEIWKSALWQSAGFAANQVKVSPFDALASIADRTPPSVQDGPVPPSASVSNPMDIRAGLRAAATSVLGAALDEGTLDRLVSEFQAEQRRAQLTQQAAARSGGTSVAAPEFATFAEQNIREVDPLKADARKKLRAAEVLQGMMTEDPLTKVAG